VNAPRHFLLCNDHHGNGICTPLVFRTVRTGRFTVLKLKADIRTQDQDHRPYTGIRIFDAELYRQVLVEGKGWAEGESWSTDGDNPVEHSLYLSLVEGLQIELRRSGFFGMKLLNCLSVPENAEHYRHFGRSSDDVRISYELDAFGMNHLTDYFLAVHRPAAAWVVLQQVQKECRGRHVHDSIQQVKTEIRRGVAELVGRLFPPIGGSEVNLEEAPPAEVLAIPVVYGEGFFQQQLRVYRNTDYVRQLLDAYEGIKRLKAALPLIEYEEVLNVTR
jgi:hypothetical protein